MIADIEYIPENKRSNTELEWHHVPVQDIRGQEAKFTIERNSFEFVKHKHELSSSDEASLRSYVEATSALLQDRFRADRVICYDSLVSPVFSTRESILNNSVPAKSPSKQSSGSYT
jgi:hypothetical protein